MALHKPTESQVAAALDRVRQLLEGTAPDQRLTTPERVDWDGVKAVLMLFETAQPVERKALLAAFDRVVRQGRELPANVVAPIIVLASVLDLWDLEPAVRELSLHRDGLDTSVTEAATNFLAFRHVA